MTFVMDCSFAVALFLPDEFSSKVRSFFNKINSNDELLVPNLWWYELSNVLVVSERRKRLSYSDIIKIINLFDQMNIKTDILNGTQYSQKIFDISRTHNLSAYDASYLELSIRKDATIASLDDKLLNAAKEAGLKIY